MRHAISCMIMLCLWAVPTFSQRAPESAQKSGIGPASKPDSAVIQEMEADWLQGERTTDVAVLERVLADDFVNLVPRGGIGATKADLIRNLRPRAGQAPPSLLETQDMRVYVLGDTAVAA